MTCVMDEWFLMPSWLSLLIPSCRRSPCMVGHGCGLATRGLLEQRGTDFALLSDPQLAPTSVVTLHNADWCHRRHSEWKHRKPLNYGSLIMIALRADSGNLGRSFLYFSKTSVPCCSAVMGTERFVAGSPFFSPPALCMKITKCPSV